MESLSDVSVESYSIQDKYSFCSVAKSLLACGMGMLAVGISGGTSTAIPISRTCSSPALSIKTGSDEMYVSRMYESYNPTWSNVNISPIQTRDSVVNIPESLSIIKLLAFVDGDNEAEINADNFFNSKKIKTKKVLFRKKK